MKKANKNVGVQIKRSKKLDKMVIQLSNLSDELDIDFPNDLFDLADQNVSSSDVVHHDHLRLFNKALKLGKPIIEIADDCGWGENGCSFAIGTLEEVEGKFKTHIERLEEKLRKQNEQYEEEAERDVKAMKDDVRNDRIKSLKKELAKLEKEKASEK